MENSQEKLAYEWIMAKSGNADTTSEFYCATRDFFEVRFGRMIREFFEKRENDASIVSAIIGEIANNSFDHNIGNWKDIPGIYFGYYLSEDKIEIVLADRGRGIFSTLKKVKPEIKNDQEALMVAFTERISGRAPEKRGNGLKFVRENVRNKKMHLSFYSGNAKAELNDKMKIEENSENIGGCLVIITL
jgi:hypothetical protein